MRADIAGAYGIAWALLLLTAPAYLHANAQPSTDDTGDDSTYGYTLTTPSTKLIVLSMALVFSVFFVAFFSIFCYECNNSHSSNSVGGESGAISVTRRPPSPGLDPAVIKTFPILRYAAVKGHKIGKESLECAVCLSGFEDYDTLRLLPKCNHVFHLDCIDPWLASHTTCPVCRGNLYRAAEANETAGGPLQSRETMCESSRQNSTSRQGEEQDHDVVINVEEFQSGDCAHAVEIVNRPPAKRISGKFPRSHSTGHSFLQAEEIRENTDADRFTLRLPEDVRKQVLECGELMIKPPSSHGVVLVRIGSSRKSYRSGRKGGISWV